MVTRSGRLVGMAAMLVVAVGGVVSVSDGQDAATGSELQGVVDGLTRQDGFPAALATVSETAGPDGTARYRTVRSGVGDLDTGAPVPYDGRVRMGSSTKTLVATVVLQLVDRGRIALDAPVERYLPGLVRGNGNDGRRIRIRHLLQHTSGLPDYADHLPFTPENLDARFQRFSSTQLLDLALAHPPTFQPGETGRWAYTNTGYELLGMVIEKVTGHSWQHEVTERVIKPLALDTMYLPRTGEHELRGPHPRSYLTVPGPAGPRPADVTEFEPSVFGAAGMLVSTPRDYNRFLTALLDGDLLSPEILAEMKRTDPATRMWPGAEYGLGLIRTPLSCGGYVYGHSGDVPGYSTRSGVAVDAAGHPGRSGTVVVTRASDTVAQGLDLVEAVDTALCDRAPVE
ncbi:serine hydrolase domain-containing protein [Actinophytocola sp.]|uniref:serine hydrolase domain-containing protein n=1 Tax=Actinophytocola sp. TaxID=1872138 RepID=UPI002D649BA5|nr:serine hydrolase domain-containing protein [Actinophytocola sp.]HYQ68259.1 serine hydrolase domain-containing protein [Actinophytocola sp.]